MALCELAERVTQNRVVALFRDVLGYAYLGDWTDRPDNSNIEEGLVSAWLAGRGYGPDQIAKALHALRTEAFHPNRSLYENNRQVYGLLRYGVPVKSAPGRPTESVRLIDWERPGANSFALAQEVTLRGGHERRPDLVLYVNGLAFAVLELKRSGVSLNDGIRQNLSNQLPEFNAWFFPTVQFVFAGNDSEGLHYGAVGTPEKYFLSWKEDETDDSGFKLDKYLVKMCRPERCIELMRDFVVFDGGEKKLPRVHQYFAVKAAQEAIAAGRGGIIWHTQGSGKSIVMVLLAKWLLANSPNARVVIVTDRDELDKQIEGVFREAGEPITRTGSGRELMGLLGKATPRLLCSLIHKFGPRGVDDFEAFISELSALPVRAVGDLFVFVDECHRTQSGKLHRTMKARLGGAVFIGFTGTPLLAADRRTTFEVFGGYIHTYKFDEAVADRVVLDLIYEARDVEQRLASEDRVDAWFEAKTRGLNDWQKSALREQWGTMQKVLSSASRMDRIIQDIVFDFSVKPRLFDGRGNSMLVAASIYDACKYFELLGRTPLRGKCAVVTSYNPQAKDVALEETGANTETDKQFIYQVYTELLGAVDAAAGKSRTETYEDAAKKAFKERPADMRLLVVVDKLLTGFDAPHCTYLYIDKSMRDHGLFQAVCRTNRLDGDDKPFGYIVDYKDLFKRVEDAIAVYASELDHSSGGANPEVFLQDRLKKGRDRLDASLEALALLCEAVEPPQGLLQHIRYFCGNTELPEDLAEREGRRTSLYTATVSLVRAYAAIADELEAAGYTPADRERIRRESARYLEIRQAVRLAASETIDLKAYEADMRHLIDAYISAEPPRKISAFDDLPLLELIARLGIDRAVAALPSGLRDDPDAVAETIVNNVRVSIKQERLNNPAYYDRMSAILEEIIADLKAKRIDYAQLLQKTAELARKIRTGADDASPAKNKTQAQRALYDNLYSPEWSASIPAGVYRKDPEAALDLALRIDATVQRVKPDDFRGNQAKENEIKRALLPLLENDVAEVERVFAIIIRQGEY
ncbi:MAG: restriction endonuclease subunit R [Treponema sp. GWC1_61_84]|nr:MAG: restriction endonuclease subunit R [Treponema sp. GWC1_61_84]